MSNTSTSPQSNDGGREGAQEATVGVEERLARIEARLGRLEDSLDRLDDLLDRMPMLVATMTDVVDDRVDGRQADIDARARRLVRIADQLTDQKTLDGLERLAANGHKLEKAVEVLEAMPGNVATVVDVFDEFVARSTAEGIDVIQVGQQLSAAANRFARFIQGPQFQALLDSGILDPESVEMVGHAGRALAQAGADGKDEEAGLFGLLGAMRDDDVRRAVGFAVAFARQFGADLKNDPLRLPAGSDD